MIYALLGLAFSRLFLNLSTPSETKPYDLHPCHIHVCVHGLCAPKLQISNYQNYKPCATGV